MSTVTIHRRNKKQNASNDQLRNHYIPTWESMIAANKQELKNLKSKIQETESFIKDLERKVADGKRQLEKI